MIIAIIPARGGSKGIPKKNIVDFGGYPLIAYSIIAAKLSKRIDRVIVSTDSEEIASIAKKYGAEVPFLRPKEFATDKSPDIDFVKHALNWLDENENVSPELIIHLSPTVPLRNPEIIDLAIQEMVEDGKATSLRSAYLSEQTGYKLAKIKKEYWEFFGGEDFEKGEEYYNLPRQELPPTYDLTCYVDILLPKTIKETGTLHGDKIKPFIISPTPDIDGLSDLEEAKKILEKNNFFDKELAIGDRNE
jgi:CMP-N-acetylneuraminic acid synthetase